MGMGKRGGGKGGGFVTRENQVQRQEVGADGHDDHGEGEGEELDDYVPGGGLGTRLGMR